MGRIRVLDKTVANMIAAGEVVERPASVVKELLENAMDAGASHVTVEIKSGGIAYIRVADDGCGMSQEDAATCLLRHATSKISTAEDLAAIGTLGFRGEALASIAAVANIDIYTKTADSELGTHLSCRCGETPEIAEAGCPQGTTVLVRDLFCSTPARMKFLKKDHTEAGYIADMLNRLALSHPDISFKLIHNGKEALFTSGDGELVNCVYSVYGREAGKAMVPVHYKEAPVEVAGLAGRGEISRPNRNMQNFFINGRYIKSPLLSRAAEDAYKNELMAGKFPALIINIAIDPSLVDINVHPTKLEAKFADEKHIYHCVYWAVKNALHANVHIPKVQETVGRKAFEMPESAERKAAEPIRVEEASTRAIATEEAHQTAGMQLEGAAGRSVRAATDMLGAAARNAETSKPAKPDGARQKDKPSFGLREPALIWPIPEFIPPQTIPMDDNKKQTPEDDTIRESGRSETASAPQWEEKAAAVRAADSQAGEDIVQAVEPETQQNARADKPAPEYQIRGQVFDTYLIVEKDGEMLMVDQHAAHERLRYEELLRQYRERKVAAQSLLIPSVVTLSAQEMAVWREHEEEIAALGFDAEEFGANAVALRAAPEELSDRDLGELFLSIITMFSENRKNVGEDLVSRMLYSIACKGAIKANHNLHEAEMKALLDAVFALDGINTCPHGRPITIAFTKSFIEKQFKRII